MLYRLSSYLRKSMYKTRERYTIIQNQHQEESKES